MLTLREWLSYRTGDIAGMNPNTGELRRLDSKEEEEALKKLGFKKLPEHLQNAAKKVLRNKKEARVSLTSGGLLSRWAAKERAVQKHKMEKKKKAKKRMEKLSRRRNRKR